MKAILLAAGRGARLRPLTDTVPKPLLTVGGRPLIEWHILALARAGVRDIVVNTAWLGEQFPLALGDGSRWGVRLHYSMEGCDHGHALETAGGIAKALPLLGVASDDPFWAIAADICAPAFDHAQAAAASAFASTPSRCAHLWTVPNPVDHAHGDFSLSADGQLQPRSDADGNCTYAGIGLFRAALFDGVPVGTVVPIGPRLQAAAAAGRVGGTALHGPWANVGTAAELSLVNSPQWRQALVDGV